MSHRPTAVIGFFLRPYRLFYAGIAVVILTVSLLESLSLAAFMPVFELVFGHPGAATPLGQAFSGLFEAARWLPIRDPLVSASLLLLALMVGKVGLTLLREYLTALASGRVLYETKRRLMELFARAPYHYFLDTKHGLLTHNTLIATQKLSVLLLRIPQLAAELLKVGAIAAVLFLAWPAAAAALAMIGAGYTALTQAVGRRISYNVGSGKVTALTEQTNLLHEWLTGIRHLMLFGAQPAWLKRFDQTNRTYRDLYTQDLFWMALPQSVLELTVIALMVGAVLIARTMVEGGRGLGTVLPVLGLFTVALMRLVPSLNGVGRLRMEMAGTVPYAEQLYGMLNAPPPPRRDGTRVFGGLRQEIRFEHVAFTHQERAKLLEDVSVVFRKGTTTGLVGPSGAGKTTLINLLLGLFEPTSGRITLDGVPLAEFRLSTWLARVGVVPQDPFIIHATVEENIRFGRSGFSRDEVRRAARSANAHEFIEQLPQGYDTVVGERGMKLSGGQQQRVAIARAMLAGPEVLIFDEATSHLDAQSERLIQEAIRELARDRTVLLVAHRHSSIAAADVLVRLDRGRVVEAGLREALV